VRGGSDPADHRFVILSETAVPAGGFIFTPMGAHMTTADARAALIARGMSEADANALIDEATEAFGRR